MTAAASAAPTRRVAPAVARAAVFGAAVAVVWWLGSATAGAEPLDGAAPGAAAPGTATSPDLMELVDAAVTPLLAPTPAGMGAPATAAAPPHDLVTPVVEPLTRSVASTLQTAGRPGLTPVPSFVDPMIRHLVAPVSFPAATTLAAPLAAAGLATDASTAAGDGVAPAAEELAPGPLPVGSTPALPGPGAIAPAAPPVPVPAPVPAAAASAASGPATRSAPVPATRSVDHADGPVAPVAAAAPALPAAPDGPDDRPGPRPSGRRLPWATGPSGASAPGNARDLPDRSHGAVVDAVASARVATPAERAPVTSAAVGGSVNAASRPAVTPD